MPMKHLIVNSFLVNDMLYKCQIVCDNKSNYIYLLPIERIRDVIGEELSYVKENLIIVKDLCDQLIYDSINEYLELANSHDTNLFDKEVIVQDDHENYRLYFQDNSKVGKNNYSLDLLEKAENKVVIEIYTEISGSEDGNIDFYVSLNKEAYAFTAYTPANIRRLLEDGHINSLSSVIIIKRIDQSCLENAVRKCLQIGINKIGTKQSK